MLATSTPAEMEGSSSLNSTGDQGSFLGVAMGFCSVCLDTVRDSSERSVAKLKCGHFFHLDCIGSAFNAKGSMQCPNCRYVEAGQWLYANGAHYQEDTLVSGLEADAYELFAGLIDTFQPSEDMLDLFPASYQRFSVVLEGPNHPPSTSTEHVVPVLHNAHNVSNSFHACPYLVAQRIAFNGSVGASYSTVESFSPLQIRHRSENSTGMPLSILNRSTWGSHAARNVQASRNVQNLDIAASVGLPYERGGWSRSGSGNQVAFNHGAASGNNLASSYGGLSGNRLASSHGHSSMQVGQPGANRRPNPQLSSGTTYRPNANNQGQRVNQPSNIASRHEYANNSNRPREREWPTGIYPDFDRLSNGSARRGTREDPSSASGSTVGWHSNAQRYPLARDRHSSLRRSADGDRYRNPAQHTTISEPASRVIIGSQSATPGDSLTASGPSVGWQNNVQRYASARERHSGSRRSAYNRDLDRNPRQHASPRSTEGITFGSISPRTLQAFERSSLSQVESHNSFEEHFTQHTHANQIPSAQEFTQDGSIEHRSPYFVNSREPQT